MKFEVYFLLALCAIGLKTTKLTLKGWLAVGVFVFFFIMYNWRYA